MKLNKFIEKIIKVYKLSTEYYELDEEELPKETDLEAKLMKKLSKKGGV